MVIPADPAGCRPGSAATTTPSPDVRATSVIAEMQALPGVAGAVLPTHPNLRPHHRHLPLTRPHRRHPRHPRRSQPLRLRRQRPTQQDRPVGPTTERWRHQLCSAELSRRRRVCGLGCRRAGFQQSAELPGEGGWLPHRSVRSDPVRLGHLLRLRRVPDRRRAEARRRSDRVPRRRNAGRSCHWRRPCLERRSCGRHQGSVPLRWRRCKRTGRGGGCRRVRLARHRHLDRVRRSRRSRSRAYR